MRRHSFENWIEPVGIPDHVNESINALADLHSRTERHTTKHQRGIERATQFLGRPYSLYVIVVVVVGWIGLNLAYVHFNRIPFDPPPFCWLQGIATFLALLISTMVLVVQNRQNTISQKRSTLDLQINLLAERKTAKIIELLEELRRDIPSVVNRRDVEAQEMSSALDPQLVAAALERSINGDGQLGEVEEMEGE